MERQPVATDGSGFGAGRTLPAAGDQGRLAPLRAELLPALPALIVKERGRDSDERAVALVTVTAGLPWLSTWLSSALTHAGRARVCAEELPALGARERATGDAAGGSSPCFVVEVPCVRDAVRAGGYEAVALWCEREVHWVAGRVGGERA